MKNIALLGCGGMGKGHAKAIASGSGNPIWYGIPGLPEGKLHETDSDVDTVLTLAKNGHAPGAPLQFNFVLGVQGCAPATVSNLDFMVRQIPAEIGRAHV